MKAIKIIYPILGESPNTIIFETHPNFPKYKRLIDNKVIVGGAIVGSIIEDVRDINERSKPDIGSKKDESNPKPTVILQR